LAVLFEPFIPGAFTKNASGPWPRRNTQHVIQIFIEQLNATDPGDMVENTQQLHTGASIIEKAAGPANLAGLGRYPNYYLQGTPAPEFFLGNVPKLQHIKKQFDPTNRFNKMIAITPA
jgi:FAD/FMN-containing dehydrogenase